jgi:hypothetical protein
MGSRAIGFLKFFRGTEDSKAVPIGPLNEPPVPSGSHTRIPEDSTLHNKCYENIRILLKIHQFVAISNMLLKSRKFVCLHSSLVCLYEHLNAFTMLFNLFTPSRS